MTKPKIQREEWEKEFEKKFVRDGEVGGSFEVAGEKWSEIASFIRSVRTQAIKEAREEVVEEIREIIENADYGDGSCDTKDLLSKLKPSPNVFNKEDCPCVCHEDDYEKCSICEKGHKE